VVYHADLTVGYRKAEGYVRLDFMLRTCGSAMVIIRLDSLAPRPKNWHARRRRRSIARRRSP